MLKFFRLIFFIIPALSILNMEKSINLSPTDNIEPIVECVGLMINQYQELLQKLNINKLEDILIRFQFVFRAQRKAKDIFEAYKQSVSNTNDPEIAGFIREYDQNIKLNDSTYMKAVKNKIAAAHKHEDFLNPTLQEILPELYANRELLTDVKNIQPKYLLFATLRSLIGKDMLISFMQDIIQKMNDEINKCINAIKEKQLKDPRDQKLLEILQTLLPLVAETFQKLLVYFNNPAQQILSTKELSNVKTYIQSLSNAVSEFKSYNLLKSDKKKKKTKKPYKCVSSPKIKVKETKEEIIDEPDLTIKNKKVEESVNTFDLIECLNDIVSDYFSSEHMGKLTKIDNNQIHIFDTRNNIAIVLQPKKDINITTVIQQSCRILKDPKFKLGPRAWLWYDDPLQAINKHEKKQFSNINKLEKPYRMMIVDHTFPRFVDLFAWLCGEYKTFQKQNGEQADNRVIKGLMIYANNKSQRGEFSFAWSTHSGLYHRSFMANVH